ncbi:MAG: hypothetical protein AAB909_05050 [Patescibacteria group bacterium]
MKKPGFTIIELLLYMGILPLILIVLSIVFSDLVNLQLSSRAISSVEQGGRFILARLAYDIRRASSVTTPATPGISSPSLALVISGVTHTYSVVDGQLTLTVGGQTDTLSGSDIRVDGFSVLRLGNPTGEASLQISVDLGSLDSDLSGQDQAVSYQTTVTQR